MNSSGKEKIAEITGHNLTNLFTNQNPPISLKWKEVPSAASTDETKMEFVSGNADDVHKNTARTSCTPNRTLITRNEILVLQPAYGYHTAIATLQCNTNTHRTRYNP